MQPSISLTELRQRIFQFADRVIETGEPLVIERRGTRLRLVREDAVTDRVGRLARMKPRKQSVVVGSPLDPHESPAEWSGELYPQGFHSMVTEPLPEPSLQPKKRSRRRR